MTESSQQNHRFAFSIVTTLFFLWGFTTVANDILIPYFKELFVLSHTQSMLVNMSFFGAYGIGSLVYFLISLTKGDPINKIGYKNGIMIGLLISGVACLLFYPLTPLHNFYLMLLPLFVLGLGFTMLQISCNPYVAILGPKESASSRLNLSQGFNSFGTAICPMFIGYIILSYYEGDSSIQVPYGILGIVFIACAFLIRGTKMPEFKQDEKKLDGSALKFRHLRLGMLAIFFYVGAEVAIASKLLEYVKLPDIGNLESYLAPSYVGIYWGGAMIGRLTTSVISSSKYDLGKKILYGLLVSTITFIVLLCAVSCFMRIEFNGAELRWNEVVNTFKDIWPLLPFIFVQFICMLIFRNSSKNMLAAFSVIAIVLLIIAFFIRGEIAMWSIISIGLFNSIMWSNIFTLSIEDLKEYTAQASSLLVIMIVGGAFIPMLMGIISDSADLQSSYLLPIISYLYIAFFGLFGTKKEELDYE